MKPYVAPPPPEPSEEPEPGSVQPVRGNARFFLRWAAAGTMLRSWLVCMQWLRRRRARRRRLVRERRHRQRRARLQGSLGCPPVLWASAGPCCQAECTSGLAGRRSPRRRALPRWLVSPAALSSAAASCHDHAPGCPAAWLDVWLTALDRDAAEPDADSPCCNPGELPPQDIVSSFQVTSKLTATAASHLALSRRCPPHSSPTNKQCASGCPASACHTHGW